MLTAANLAQIHDATSQKESNLQLYLQQTSPTPTDGSAVIPAFHVFPKVPDKTQELDNVSIASSMHFTVVNVNQRTRTKQRSFCSKHQLTILVITMSVLFTIGIISAIFFIESKCGHNLFYFIIIMIKIGRIIARNILKCLQYFLIDIKNLQYFFH